jgi:nucleotide-binding universal stress UspA family protein
LSDPSHPSLPFVASVLHATDFSPASEKAFAHALAISLLRQTRLWLLHAGRRELGGDDWRKFPPVRATLERWGLLEPGSPRSAVFEEFQVRATKVALEARDPLDAVIEFLEDKQPDLLVVGTEARTGLPRWRASSAAERLARHSHTMTLFVPDDSRGFVNAEDGHMSLRRILVPVDAKPDPAAAAEMAARVARAIGDAPVAIHFVHVGTTVPEPPLSDEAAFSVRASARAGDPVEQIVDAASEDDVDLIVMATEGRQGVVDALRGTVTERVLREARRPLLAVCAR